MRNIRSCLVLLAASVALLLAGSAAGADDTTMPLSSILNLYSISLINFPTSYQECSGPATVPVVANDGSSTPYVYTNCSSPNQFALSTDATSATPYYPVYYYSVWCPASKPTFKIALDLTKLTLASVFYYDCALGSIVQCAQNAIFDQISQACTSVIFAPDLCSPGVLASTMNPDFTYTDLCYASKSDYINSLYKCANATWTWAPKKSGYKKCDPYKKYRTADGTCNNLMYSWWGASFTPYKRIALPAYDDYKGKPRRFSVMGNPLESPRLIASQVHFSQDQTAHVSHYVPIFGQYVMHDMARTGHTYERGEKTPQIKKCPCDSASPSCVNIEIPTTDPVFSQRAQTQLHEESCLVQVRERDSRDDFRCDLGHREQTNEATAWLDQSNTYGNTPEQEESLRTHKNGRLKVSYADDDKSKMFEFMPNKCDAVRDLKLLVKSNVCFNSGDDRVNENPLLAGVHTIFLRTHNQIVDALHTLNPSWSDKRLYREGRRIVNAIYQNIIYSEWLPLVVGEYFYKAFGLQPMQTYQALKEYSPDGYFNKYDPYIMPNVAIEFSAGAGRFGHGLIRSMISRADQKYQKTGNKSLTESLFQPGLLIKDGDASFNEWMRGCIADLANNNPPHITKDLLNYLVVDHGNLNPSLYHSLPTLNIGRGRETGLQGYNNYRPHALLNRAYSFDDLTWIDKEDRDRLKKVYTSVNDIDLFTGAMTEKKVTGGLVGPTFAYILARGFRDWKYADRFYYENSPLISPYPFTPAQLNSIRSVRFSSILCNTLNIKKVPLNAFLKQDDKTNPAVACSSLGQVDLRFFREIAY